MSEPAPGRPTPLPRPLWLRIAAPLAVAGIVGWPVLAMLGLLGVVPAQAVLNTGIVTAGLAYVSVRRVKADRARLTDADPEPDPE